MVSFYVKTENTQKTKHTQARTKPNDGVEEKKKNG